MTHKWHRMYVPPALSHGLEPCPSLSRIKIHPVYCGDRTTLPAEHFMVCLMSATTDRTAANFALLTKSTKWYRWWDSNPRPSGPRPDALPDCATPIYWYAMKDLNLRLLPCKGSTLPTELMAHNGTST